jgi:hypothetical protein
MAIDHRGPLDFIGDPTGQLLTGKSKQSQPVPGRGKADLLDYSVNPCV